VERSGRNLFKVLSHHLFGRTEEKQEIRGQDGIDIRTREWPVTVKEDRQRTMRVNDEERRHHPGEMQVVRHVPQTAVRKSVQK
jgi:hypothetical protein